MTNWNNYPEFRSIIKKYGHKFCGAPFSSLILEPSGTVKFCCMAKDSIGDLREGSTKPADIVNSSLAKAVRREFLNGRMEERATVEEQSIGTNVEKYCDVCWSQEKLYKFPTDNRLSNTEWAKDVIDDLVKNTDVNGHIHKQAPAWLDIAFSNKCNFACMGCESAYSTTIGKYFSAYEVRDGDTEIHSIGPNVDTTALWNEDDWLMNNVDADSLIDYIIEHKDTIHRIHFQGGEPFMMPEVYKTLDKLIEYDLYKEDGIKMWAHTNGSVRTYKGVDIIKKYVSKWEDRFQITMSHDGCGPRGEYIRYGYKDKKWLEIFNRIIKSKCHVGIQHSINIFNVLHQYDCLEWYLNNCLSAVNTVRSDRIWSNPNDFFVVINPWGLSVFNFSLILAIPVLRERAINVLEKCVERCNEVGIDSSNYAKYLSTLLSTETTEIDNKLKDRFVLTVTEFDKVRGTNFHETFPELKPLWNYCNG